PRRRQRRARARLRRGQEHAREEQAQGNQEDPDGALRPLRGPRAAAAAPRGPPVDDPLQEVPLAMHAQQPIYLYIAGGVLVVLALAYALDETRRRFLLERIGHAPQLKRMAASASPVRRWIKAGLTVLGITLVVLALARPQVKGQTIWKQRGIDVVV